MLSGRDLTMWFVVCAWLCGHLSDNLVVTTLFKLSAHWPCSVWNQFSINHNWQVTSKTGGRMVGSDAKVWLTIEADCRQYHLFVTLMLTVITDISAHGIEKLECRAAYQPQYRHYILIQQMAPRYLDASWYRHSCQQQVNEIFHNLILAVIYAFWVLLYCMCLCWAAC